MIKFSDTTQTWRNRFMDAWFAIVTRPYPDSCGASWSKPWLYAAEWLVDATEPEEAAEKWFISWRDYVVNRACPSCMEVFYD